MLRFLMIFVIGLVVVSTFAAQETFPVITPQNAADLRPLAFFPASINSSVLIGFSADNRYVVTQNNTVYDLETGDPSGGGNPAIYDPPYTAQVKRPEYYYYGTTADIIDDQTGNVVRTINPNTVISGTPVVSPDGKLIAVSISRYDGWNSSIGTLLYNNDNGLIVAQIAGGSPVFSADGTRIAAIVDQNIVAYAVNAPLPPSYRMTATVAASMINLRAAPSHDAAILSHTIRGRLVIDGLSEDRVFAYVSELGGWVRADENYIRLPLYFRREWLPIIDLATYTPPPTSTPTATFTPSPTYLWMTSTPTHTRTPANTPTPMPTVQGAVPIIADNVDTLELLGVLDTAMCTRNCITLRSGFSLDGQMFVVQTGYDQTPRMYSLDTLTLQVQADSTPVPNNGQPLFLELDNKRRVSSNGQWYVTVDGREPARVIYDVMTRRQVFRIPRHIDVQDIQFSPDAKSLITRDNDFVRIWDIEGRTVVERARIPVYYNASMAYSPDGKVLAIVTAGEMRLYDAQTAGLLQKYPGAGSPGYNSDFAFSPDSRWLVMSPPLRLIDMETGTVYPIEEDPAASQGYRVTFSPDSNLLLVGNDRQIFVLGIAR